MNENTNREAQERGKRIFTYRETTPKRAAQAAYYLLDAIRNTAEQMKATPDEAEAAALQIDVAGWADKIGTLTELAQNEIFLLIEQ